jgi:hypothetical protein
MNDDGVGAAKFPRLREGGHRVIADFDHRRVLKFGDFLCGATGRAPVHEYRKTGRGTI